MAEADLQGGGGAGGGGGNFDWAGFTSALPDDLRAEPSLSTFKEPTALVKAYVDTKKLVGDPAVLRPPKDEAQRPEWEKATRGKLAELGLITLPPDSADKYEFKFDGVDAEVIKSDPVTRQFGALAHSLGLSNAQAQGLLEGFAKDLLPAMQPKPGLAGDDVTAILQKTFGANTTKALDDYRRNMGAIAREYPAVAQIIKDGYADDGQGNMLANPFDHPDVIRFINDKFDTSQDSGGGINGASAQSLAAIEAELKTYMQDPSHDNYKAYQVRNDPLAAAKVKELFAKLAAAGKKTSNIDSIDHSQVAK